MNRLILLSQSFITLCQNKPKELGLSALLILFSAFVFYKSTPPFVSKVFELKIYKNKNDIKQLTDERDIVAEKTVFVDRLMLRDGFHLVHPKLGKIGFDGNFFIDIKSSFTVKIPGKYFLYPGSDDGFALKVDGELLCEYLGGRAYSTRSCPITLDEGKHDFELNYYQGFGHSGLTLAYRHADGKKQKWFGDNSRYLNFH